MKRRVNLISDINSIKADLCNIQDIFIAFFEQFFKKFDNKTLKFCKHCSKKEHYPFTIPSAYSLFRFLAFNKQIKTWKFFKNMEIF
jgi:hypothetical protein